MLKVKILEHGLQLLATDALPLSTNNKDILPKRSSEWLPTDQIVQNWASEESIISFSSAKANYQSILHFSWFNMFHIRDTDNLVDAKEWIAETSLLTLSQAEAIAKVTAYCSSTYAKDFSWPSPCEIYLLWDDWNDVFIGVETSDRFIGWSWSTSE